MHELSIAQSILDTVLAERESRGLEVVDSVTVRVGALSGVFPDALEFCFEAIRLETPLANTRLVIDPVPITVRCRDCAAVTKVEDFLFVCPVCDSVHVNVESGYELEVTSLEVPDAEPALVEP